jgi:deazaflavin-dependent oxidoreductase (nitroreductase family)
MTGDRRPMGLYARLLERFGRSRPGYWWVTTVAPRLDPPLLRLSGGRVSSVFPLPTMLLTTIGAKSGLRRTLPLLYVADGDSLVVIASNYGRAGHPAWFRNLQAHPRAEVLAGSRSGTYEASVVEDAAQREALWDRALDLYAGYADYEQRTSRSIPLVRLRRVT